MLDYLLGDKADAEEEFDELYGKYDSVQAKIEIADEQFTIERRWKEPGFKTKVLVNGEARTVDDYREWLMNTTRDPDRSLSEGKPLRCRELVGIGVRSLCRHVYRQQRFWSDLADQQPPVEQHASILQLLGLAQHLFTVQYGELVTKEKKILSLQVEKDQFVSMLQAVSKEIVDEEELGVALTPQSIDAAQRRIEEKIAQLQAKRNEALDDLLVRATDHANSSFGDPPP